jgi:mannose-1-phosphate guanylyltransferase
MTLSVADFDPSTELVAVIMAGGAGTRFWPASTETRPKQFLRLFGERSLIQLTWDRVVELCGPERILVLTHERFVPHVREQLPELSEDNILGEPLRRDTSAPVAMSALLARHRFGDPVIATLTSDHLIEPKADFQAALLSAARAAKASAALYTFGIEPTRPATEYGYLAVADDIGDDDGVSHHHVSAFLEKPDLPHATEYAQDGKHLWNSGMFVWRASTVIAELERQLPAHVKHLQPAVEADRTDRFDEALLAAFEPLDKISVDYGLMEGAHEVRCVRGRFDWSDVGGFAALADHLPTDDDANVHRGGIIARDAKDNLVFCDDDSERVALVGVEGLLVVRAGGRTLVMPRDRVSEIKQLVNSLPEEER